MIVARDVTVRAGRRTLLDAVSLTLPHGSFTAILGPNGAGKTTLLRVLAGAVTPDHGGVTLAGTPLAQFGAADLARRRAVLSQNSAPVLGLTVADTVALGRLVFRRSPEAADDKAAIAAVRCQFSLGGLWQRAVGSLSGGERQRVQIARAAAQLWRWDAKADGLALFLDEPAASLDLAQQGLALRFAHEYAQNGAAVLAVLHNPNHAIGADQVALLRDGRLLECGPPATVLTQAKLENCLGVALPVARKEDGSVAFVA